MHKLKVTYDDGRESIVALSPRLEVEYERNFHASITTLAEFNERFYWMAWKGLNRAGQETRDFEAFLDSVDEVTLADAESSDPTPPSPPSPSSSD